MRKALSVLLVAGSLVFLAGCSRQQPELVGSQTDNIARNQVLLTHRSFIPRVLTIAAGQTVTWRWDDGPTPHNVVLDVGGQTVTSPSRLDGTFRYTFQNPGTYHYRCTLHENMVGTVVVGP